MSVWDDPEFEIAYERAYRELRGKRRKLAGGAKKRRIRRAVLTRDGNQCVVCGSRDDLTLDHIVPRSKGGANLIRNLQTMCRPCNEEKAARDEREAA